MQRIQKAFIKNNNKILVLLRSNNDLKYPKTWDLPGGVLEQNEEPDKGIIRQVFEKTKLIVEPVKIIKEIKYYSENSKTDKRVSYYQTNLKSNEIKLSDEHSNYKWVPENELQEINLNPQVHMFFNEVDR